MHFRGQSILKASIAKLVALGMAKATHVLLTGVVWSGTAVVLHADAIGVLLKAALPELQVRLRCARTDISRIVMPTYYYELISTPPMS